MYCEFALHISGVFDLRRLEQHHCNFLLSHWTMLHAAWNNQKLAFVQRNAAISKFHAEPAAHHQKQFVFLGVAVPNKLALKLHQFQVLAIQFSYNARIPVIGKQCQFLADVDLFHVMRLTTLLHPLRPGSGSDYQAEFAKPPNESATYLFEPGVKFTPRKTSVKRAVRSVKNFSEEATVGSVFLELSVITTN